MCFLFFYYTSWHNIKGFLKVRGHIAKEKKDSTDCLKVPQSTLKSGFSWTTADTSGVSDGDDYHHIFPICFDGSLEAGIVVFSNDVGNSRWDNMDRLKYAGVWRHILKGED